jgi:hypothetical protein
LAVIVFTPAQAKPGLLHVAARQHHLAPSVIGRLLLVDRLRITLRIPPLLGLAVAEQELDEAAAHAGAVGGSGAHRRHRLYALVGVEYLRFGGRGLDGGSGMNSGGEAGCAGQQREGHFSEHRRTLYCFVCLPTAPEQRRRMRSIQTKT